MDSAHKPWCRCSWCRGVFGTRENAGIAATGLATQGSGVSVPKAAERPPMMQSAPTPVPMATTPTDDVEWWQGPVADGKKQGEWWFRSAQTAWAWCPAAEGDAPEHKRRRLSLSIQCPVHFPGDGASPDPTGRPRTVGDLGPHERGDEPLACRCCVSPPNCEHCVPPRRDPFSWTDRELLRTAHSSQSAPASSSRTDDPVWIAADATLDSVGAAVVSQPEVDVRMAVHDSSTPSHDRAFVAPAAIPKMNPDRSLAPATRVISDLRDTHFLADDMVQDVASPVVATGAIPASASPGEIRGQALHRASDAVWDRYYASLHPGMVGSTAAAQPRAPQQQKGKGMVWEYDDRMGPEPVLVHTDSPPSPSAMDDVD